MTKLLCSQSLPQAGDFTGTPTGFLSQGDHTALFERHKGRARTSALGGDAVSINLWTRRDRLVVRFRQHLAA